MGNVRILVADDHALVRRGLIALLDGLQDIEIVGEAADGFEVIRLAEEKIPDVILMDLKMPRLDGVVAIEKIKERKLGCKILVVSNYYDDDRVVSAVKAGANGYLLKTTLPEDLLSAIKEVHMGGAPLDPAVTQIVLRNLSRNIDSDTEVDINELTARELTVLKLLAKGYSDQRIADDLLISVRTVSAHVHNILGKLGLENRTQAALYALRYGLVDLDEQ
jgi:NarL family two-component system response regulator LiaR